MNELVSVIIPTFSRPDYIVRAIESVLHQTYNPVEIIVVDDNGLGTVYQQETERLLSPYITSSRIRYIAHDINKNAQYARNTGIINSKGKYITILDDDDEMLPDKISMQVNAIKDAGGNYKMAYCCCEIRKGGKAVSQKKTNGSGNFQKSMLSQKMSIGTGSNPLFDRDVFEVTGLYDVSFKRRQDVEFLIRAFRNFRIVEVPKLLIVKNNDSKPARPNPKGYIEITQHFLDTFAQDIDKYGEKIANDIKFENWFANTLLAFDYHDFRLGYTLYLKCLEYKKIPRLNHILRILKHILLTPGKR